MWCSLARLGQNSRKSRSTKNRSEVCIGESSWLREMCSHLGDPCEDLMPKDPGMDVLEEPHSVADTT